MNQTTRTRSAMHQRSNPLDSDLLQVLLFYILPFIVINSIIFFVVTAKPKYELSVAPTNDYQTTTATFRITSHMPLKNVTITFNSQPLDLVSVGKKTYQATLTENGILDVYMQNFNGMCVSNYEVVDTLDDECPDVVSYDIDNGLLVLTLSDSQSGVDYSSLHATSAGGTVYEPLSIDKTNGKVTFQLPEGGVTVSIKDMSGNEYQPTFSVVKSTEGTGDGSEDTVILQ